MSFVDFLFFAIKMARIRIEAPRATTPPNLDGMERRTTYANKKYHSGWMWIGATSGLAGLKFSTSPKILGTFEDIRIMRNTIIIIGRESLIVNRGLNFILSEFVIEVVGLEDPFSCNRIRWTNTDTVTTIGKMKWREKNRFSVGWDTEGPPQIQVTRSFPTSGIADRTPVITVAPQNDICPQGSTYPRKAVAIIIRIKMTPEIQTFGLFL